MKNISVKTFALSVATVLSLLAGGAAFADPSVVVMIGPQAPPQPQQDHRWARPYPSAVWVAGHNEWNNGAYVWVGGYYAYPPHPHSRWIGPTYPHNEHGYYYHPGHWIN